MNTITTIIIISRLESIGKWVRMVFMKEKKTGINKLLSRKNAYIVNDTWQDRNIVFKFHLNNIYIKINVYPTYFVGICLIFTLKRFFFNFIII